MRPLTFAIASAASILCACGLLLDTDPTPRDAGSAPDVAVVDAVVTPPPRTQVFELEPSPTGCPEPYEYDPGVDGCLAYSPAVGTIRVDVPLDEYTEVWGMARGRQQQTPDAFSAYLSDPTAITLDDTYVDGISITTGTPRRHVFTLGAGLHLQAMSGNACPCDGGIGVPPFIGEAWVCETGNNRADWGYDPSYYDDILWDADAPEGTACDPLGDPGEFHVVLDAPASGPLEIRMMQDQSDDAYAVVSLVLWVR